ncbi:MAG: hypothetical protein NC192_09035, partial [Muribaculaceae bacterium]|nr:hypothetical protein [Muribaculaceae bacterium]
RSPSEWLSPFLTPFSVFFWGYTPPSYGRAPFLGAPPLDPAGALPLDPASAGLRWTSRLPKGFLVSLLYKFGC